MIARPTGDSDGTPVEWPDPRQRTDEMATVVEFLFNGTRRRSVVCRRNTAESVIYTKR